jgi:hypothetical protein
MKTNLTMLYIKEAATDAIAAPYIPYKGIRKTFNKTVIINVATNKTVPKT